jgi:hypothetical protein
MNILHENGKAYFSSKIKKVHAKNPKIMKIFMDFNGI